MSRVRFLACAAAFAAVVFAAGCAGMSGEAAWYKNRAAAGSTLEKPVLGDPDARTFVDPSIKGGRLGVVEVRPVTAKGTAGGEEMRRFLDRFSRRADAAARMAITESGRAKGFAAEGGKADTVLTIEALAHVATIDTRVTSDPILNNPDSKVFIIYTFADAATGKVLIRHTNYAASYWGHATMAMEDLENAAVKMAADLMYLLERF